MPKILEELQTRAAEAKKKLDEATVAFQAAQATQNQALQNYNVWSLALQIETREEQQRQAAATEKQLPLPNTSTTGKEAPVIVTSGPDDECFVVDAVDQLESLNKTDIVRNLLRQHPDGMAATEIWKQVHSQFQHRPYLYSILKRLRDRDEVTKRRGKYFLKLASKVEEVKEQHSVVH